MNDIDSAHEVAQRDYLRSCLSVGYQGASVTNGWVKFTSMGMRWMGWADGWRESVSDEDYIKNWSK